MGLFDKLNSKTPEQEMFKESTRFASLKLDETNKLFKYGKLVASFNDLISFELIEDKSTITQGGVDIGRAVVGGSIFGGTGATLGSLSKIKKQDAEFCSNMQILVTVKNQKKGTFIIPFIIMKADKSKAIYKQAQINAKSTLEGLNYIISCNESAIPTDSALANFEDLKKLKELFDLGILTEEEFEAKKTELLK